MVSEEITPGHAFESSRFRAKREHLYSKGLLPDGQRQNLAIVVRTLPQFCSNIFSAAVERIWRIYDMHGQILAFAFR